MILDAAGSLIWSKHFDNDFGGQAYDLKVQKYHGEQYLTFWLGDDTVRGHGWGHYYMLNSSYDIVHEVGAAGSLQADLHDFVITPEGTALLVIFEARKADVRPLGRKMTDLWNQAIWDCVVQEVNIETGDLIFEWRASDYLDLTLTYHQLVNKIGDSGTRANPFDWFHINSIDKDEHGNYLVSARNLHSLLYIDGKTKAVLWTLGGKGNSFEDLSDGHALNFAWQHDARFISKVAFPETYVYPPDKDGFTTTLMTTFDNAAMDWDYKYGPSQSRVLLLELTYPTPRHAIRQDSKHDAISPARPDNNYVTNWQESLSKLDKEKVSAMNKTKSGHTARVVKEFLNPKRIISSTQGSAQLLDQGPSKDPKVLVGYGINGVITEFDSKASVLCHMHFAAATSWEKGDVQSYRAYKFPWVGRPTQKPALAMRNNKAYVSWNGATECKEWALQYCSTEQFDDWEEQMRAPRQGFETIIPLQATSGEVPRDYVRVVAIGANGEILEHGTSEIVHRGGYLVLATESLGTFGTSLRTSPILIVGVLALLLGLAWCLGFCRPRRRSSSQKSVLPRQRTD